MGFSRQEYWSVLPFHSPVDHIMSDLSTMPARLVWPHGAWLSSTELDKAVVLVWLDWLVFCDYGFILSALWCPLATLTVLLGFLLPWTWSISSQLLQQSQAPYLGWGVSPQCHTPTPHRALPWMLKSSSRPFGACTATAPWTWICSSWPLPLASGVVQLLLADHPFTSHEIPWNRVGAVGRKFNGHPVPPRTKWALHGLCMPQLCTPKTEMGVHQWCWGLGAEVRDWASGPRERTAVGCLEIAWGNGCEEFHSKECSQWKWKQPWNWDAIVEWYARVTMATIVSLPTHQRLPPWALGGTSNRASMFTQVVDTLIPLCLNKQIRQPVANSFSSCLCKQACHSCWLFPILPG